jgi:lysozyme
MNRNHKVIDLSHHNIVMKDLSAAKAAGVRGVVHKMTEGVTVVDAKVKARWALAKDAGMLWGLYHFLRPKNVEKQAEVFLSKAEELGVIDDETLIVSDLEVGGISLVEVLHFMQAVEKATGRLPMLYSGRVLKELGGAMECPPLARYRLWLAQYGPKAILPAGYDAYWLWQYSQTGSVPGIKGEVDLNHFDGKDEELAAKWSGREE